MPKVANQIIEGLRGDALYTAMGLGLAKLSDKAGFEKLLDTIHAKVFPLKALEAKELFLQGHRIGGPLSRQSNESMTSFIDRRRRWWSLVQTLDKTIEMSNAMLGSMLLDHAMLSPTQRLMVLTANRNQTGFDTIARILLEHHGQSAASPYSSGPDPGQRHGKGKGSGWKPWYKGKGKHKGTAYAASSSEDWSYSDDYAYWDDSGWTDDAYVANDSGEQTWWSDCDPSWDVGPSAGPDDVGVDDLETSQQHF